MQLWLQARMKRPSRPRRRSGRFASSGASSGTSSRSPSPLATVERLSRLRATEYAGELVFLSHDGHTDVRLVAISRTCSRVRDTARPAPDSHYFRERVLHTISGDSPAHLKPGKAAALRTSTATKTPTSAAAPIRLSPPTAAPANGTSSEADRGLTAVTRLGPAGVQAFCARVSSTQEWPVSAPAPSSNRTTSP